MTRSKKAKRRATVGLIRHGGERLWKLSKLSLIPALIMFIGISAITYPHAAAWTTQLKQSAVIEGISTQLKNVRPDEATQLRQARMYNEALTGGAIYEAGSNVPTAQGIHESKDANILDYDHQLLVDSSGLMGRLRIPKIKLDLPIFHGTDDETLAKGLGHLRGTALPVGGEGMRPVITGHRGLAEAEMFTRLDELKKGDTFTIEVFDQVLTYRVFEKIVVKPDERRAFLAEPGRDLVTLVTCTPLGINTHRILVTGERIIPTPASELAKAGKKPEVPGFPWWLVAYICGILLILGYIRWSGMPAPLRQDTEDGYSVHPKKLAKLRRKQQAHERRRAKKQSKRAARSDIAAPSGATPSATSPDSPPPSKLASELALAERPEDSATSPNAPSSSDAEAPTSPAPDSEPQDSASSPGEAG